MARPDRRHPGNVAGRWFVDTECINCDSCRQCAPTLFGEVDDQAVVVRQPGDDDEVLAATRAMLVCPTSSIGVEGRAPDTKGVMPYEIEDGVHLCGFNSTSSFGANSFFVTRPDGNLLVDAPRWSSRVARFIDGHSGLAHVLLSHRDDVADAERYAERFGARVWIHHHDADAAPFASDVLRGEDPTEIRPGLLAIPVPGHTRGSVVYLLERRYLFTGDSLYWSRKRRSLGAFRNATWYSWKALTRSLDRLTEHDFEWVLAGHGDRHRLPAPQMREELRKLVAWMERR